METPPLGEPDEDGQDHLPERAVHLGYSREMLSVYGPVSPAPIVVTATT